MISAAPVDVLLVFRCTETLAFRKSVITRAFVRARPDLGDECVMFTLAEKIRFRVDADWNTDTTVEVRIGGGRVGFPGGAGWKPGRMTAGSFLTIDPTARKTQVNG